MSKGDGGLEGIIILFIAGVGMIYKAIKTHRRLRHVQDTPRSKVSSAAQGMAELQGFAWPLNSCMRTVSKKEAVYYDFQLQREETRGSGKDERREWVTIYRKSFKHSFLLVDPTGIAMMNPGDAELEMIQAHQRPWRRLSMEEKSQVMNEIITEGVPGFPPGDFLGGLFSSNYRVVENFILRGSPLYASGDFRTTGLEMQTVSSKGLTRFCDMIFNLEARSEKDVSKLLDKNKDGKVSHEETIDGYVFAADTAIRRTEMDQLQERDFPVFGTLKTSEQHKLFLAAALESHLIGKMKHKPALFLLGGAAATALAIVLTLSKVKPAAATFDQASRSAAVAEENINRTIRLLHGRCIQRSPDAASACAQLLLSYKKDLGPEHIQYYTTHACELGQKQFCN